MAELKAILFDLDGVLVDSHVLHYQSWQRLCDELGLDFNRELGDHFRGMARDECMRKLFCEFNNLPEPDEKRLLELMEIKNDYYHEILLKASPEELILPGAVRFLEELRAAGIKIIIGSGSKNAKIVIEQAKIGHLMDDIVDRYDVKAAKPDPEVFLIALERAGTTAEYAVGIEDANLGLDALRSAKVKNVGVGHYVIKADLLVDSVADLTVDIVRQLV